MDILFSTELFYKGLSQVFEVSFENEEYVFRNKDKSESFSVQREEDEWHAENTLPEVVKSEAVEKLEQYLLSQH